MSNNIQFWYHPISGGSSVQYLIEHYFDFKFTLYSKNNVDKRKKNIIVFLWEIKNEWLFPNFDFKTDKQEFFELMQELNNLGFYFLSDFSTESSLSDFSTKSNPNLYVSEERVLFISKLKEIGIDLSKFYLVTNNSNIDYQKSKYGEHLINYIHFPHFLAATPIGMSNVLGELDSYKRPISPLKEFVCLTRRMYEHKFIFLKKLWERGLLEKTNWTWVCNYINLDEYKEDEFVRYLDIDINNFNSFQLNDDVMYGTKLDKADEFLYTINPTWFYESKVNLVVETNPYDRSLHLTEKTFKPIFLEVPFVIFASKGHLEKLKEFGFDTFESQIGEYDCTDEDSVIDAGIRLSKIYSSEEVIKICKINSMTLRCFDTHKKVIQKYFLSRFETKLI